MVVLSLFDGISGAYQALKGANIKVDKYYASEIDKYAIQIANKNHPDIIQLGTIENACFWDLPKIDLMIGGFPCQAFSIAGKRKEFKDKRGNLFFNLLQCLKTFKPKYFLFENVASMKKETIAYISKEIGVEPIMINSSLVTAQSRKRLYWTNIPNVEQPEDKKIYLKDILESGVTERLESYCITATYRNACLKDYFEKSSCQLIFDTTKKIGLVGKSDSQGNRVYSANGKSVALSALDGGGGAKTGLYLIEAYIRKLTPIECERLQGYPDNYTDGISNTQRYKSLGNSFTVPVISHILKGDKKC